MKISLLNLDRCPFDLRSFAAHYIRIFTLKTALKLRDALMQACKKLSVLIENNLTLVLTVFFKYRYKKSINAIYVQNPHILHFLSMCLSWDKSKK